MFYSPPPGVFVVISAFTAAATTKTKLSSRLHLLVFATTIGATPADWHHQKRRPGRKSIVIAIVRNLLNISRALPAPLHMKWKPRQKKTPTITLNHLVISFQPLESLSRIFILTLPSTSYPTIRTNRRGEPTKAHSVLLLLGGSHHSVLHESVSEGLVHAIEGEAVAERLPPQVRSPDHRPGVKHTHPD